MLEFMLDVARETDGYFDPTVGKRLTELGYGNTQIENRKSKIDGNGAIHDSRITIHDDYRDIEII
jgi:thiamine biosynthesis lipoprotein ApbE